MPLSRRPQRDRRFFDLFARVVPASRCTFDLPPDERWLAEVPPAAPPDRPENAPDDFSSLSSDRSSASYLPLPTVRSSLAPRWDPRPTLVPARPPCALPPPGV